MSLSFRAMDLDAGSLPANPNGEADAGIETKTWQRSEEGGGEGVKGGKRRVLADELPVLEGRPYLASASAIGELKCEREEIIVKKEEPSAMRIAERAKQVFGEGTKGLKKHGEGNSYHNQWKKLMA